MNMNSIIILKKRLHPVKAFGLACVPFFMDMIYLWGLHHDCQQIISGGLVCFLCLNRFHLSPSFQLCSQLTAYKASTKYVVTYFVIILICVCVLYVTVAQRCKEQEYRIHNDVPNGRIVDLEVLFVDTKSSVCRRSDWLMSDAHHSFPVMYGLEHPDCAKFAVLDPSLSMMGPLRGLHESGLDMQMMSHDPRGTQ